MFVVSERVLTHGLNETFNFLLSILPWVLISYHHQVILESVCSVRHMLWSYSVMVILTEQMNKWHARRSVPSTQLIQLTLCLPTNWLEYTAILTDCFWTIALVSFCSPLNILSAGRPKKPVNGINQHMYIWTDVLLFVILVGSFINAIINVFNANIER